MRRLSSKHRLIILFTVAITSITYGGNSATDLQKISKKLQLLERKQQTDKKKQLSVTQQLKEADLTLSTIHLSLKKIRTNTLDEKKSLTAVKHDIKKLKKDLSTQQSKLSRQLTLSYQLGQYPYLKLLLNQQNPALTSRVMTYLSYLNQARVTTIKKLITTKKNLTTKENALKQHLVTLAKLTAQKKQEEIVLAAQRQNQKKLIHKLNRELRKRKDKIYKVRKDREKLVSLLKQLKQRQFNERSLHFERMRKRLPWPAKGKLSNYFNREHDGINYHGIIIKAHEGNNIRAIYPGKVVFSGWLNGYGLLLIINHGHGYMSLYANNQTLYRQRGDVVEKEEVIAALGHSGGQLEDGLYFEIRYKGKPISPLAWLK